MKVGILEFQGDIEEHFLMTKKAIENIKISAEVVLVKKNSDIKELSALIIPGGESTVIGKFIKEQNLEDEIKKFAEKGNAIMGTCAGSIILAKECNDKRINLLRLIDISVSRNAYGRQVDSFETELNIDSIGKFHCIFIRAPVIEKISDKVKVLASFRGKPIFVQQGNILALTFHPELTNDTRVHEYFLKLI
ncbi:MAG: pyridoxal 5'-phosphate synthase glutaminase subunit PdxT [Candidatus Altiarchaeota archaeon]